MLHIYNTLTRQKEIFKPQTEGQVGMYVCGMTVYDRCHLGNGRIWIFFDVVVRYLRTLGYNVNYVRNITDIDDKIIKRAAELNEDYTVVIERFIKFLHEDEKALHVLPPNIEPRVTEHLPQIIELIKALITKGYAYLAANGDVYYDISKFPTYGELAHKDLENLRVGARVEVNTAKHDPLDFVLWKQAKPNEPAWDSPWGKGRPGWHIECSAMAMRYLGKHVDIHGGGADLQFPHHQNEVAQSEAFLGARFVNYWMHVGFVQMDKQKMSKSLGNFFTVHELLAKYHAEVLRYFILASHYRSPLNYTVDNLNQAVGALTRLYTALRNLECTKEINLSEVLTLQKRFYAAMDDDFNTPEALAVLFDAARECNKSRESNVDAAAQYAKLLRDLGEILGILQSDVEGFLRGDVNDVAIERLITERNNARKNKNWQLADEIRKRLEQQGIVLEDAAGKTVWKRSFICPLK